MSACPLVTLSNGVKVPIVGLGTWKSGVGQVAEAVKIAIDAGYRHLDCAHVYQNENEVGDGIESKIKEGVIKREDLFVTSKLWNTFHRPDLVEGAVRTTLANLKIEYLDLYLIHWPMAYQEGDQLFPTVDGKVQFSDVDYVDTWKAFERLVELGLVKSIGLSNFNSQQIERVLEIAKIKPVVNQIECHPYLTQKQLSEFCKSKDIAITAYSPLGSPDRPWAQPGEPSLMAEPKIVELAEKLSKTPAQVLIRYQIERGHIVIPKSVTKERIISNFEVFDFSLSPEDMAIIDSFERNGRLVPLLNVIDHPHHPFHNVEF